MTAKNHIDSEIIEKIRIGDERNLSELYKNMYPMVQKYILDNNGSREDAKDVFQDALYIFIKKIQDRNFELSSKLSTYLFGISKNLWLKKLTKKKIEKNEYKNELDFNDLTDDDFDKLNKVQLLKRSLELLGEPCKTLIVQFYYFKESMKEIAKMLHYTNAENAKNQKYKCLMRLKKIVSKEKGEN